MTRLRAANDIVIRGSIPLGAGVSLVSSAWSMLRAAATTSVRPRAHIGGNFSKRADELAETARLGHTQEGSYVIPILMPLSDPSEERAKEPALTGLEIERVSWEPSERRIMRTFAQALAAVDQTIVQPEHTPRVSQMQPAVIAGVSRELVSALHRIVSDESVASFEATFSWAQAVTAPASVPLQVRIPADAATRLGEAARRLKSSSYSPDEIITGPIVEVRHVPEDPFGEISVQTMRRGRMTEVRVRLSVDQLEPTFEWARRSRPVAVSGRIRRSPGQRLSIDKPRQIYPVDETYLPHTEGSSD